MTFKEFGQLADAIKTYFPKDNMLPTAESMELWFDMLKDLDYQSAAYGLKKYVSLNKFPPAISDIREHAASVSKPDELNEMEAWALVRNAISNSAYNSVDEFAKLPPLVQKAVGLPGQLRVWAMDEDYSESVTSSNFIKTYRAVLERNEENKKIPAQVMKMIESTYKGSYPAQIEQKRKETIENSGGRKNNLILAHNNATEGVDTSRYREKLERLLGGNSEDGRRKI